MRDFQTISRTFIHSLPSINANTTFILNVTQLHLKFIKCHLKYYFKGSFVATCLSLTRPSSGNCHFDEITALHGLMRQYYHADTACLHIWEIYARTSLMLLLRTAFTLCSCAWSDVCPLWRPDTFRILDSFCRCNNMNSEISFRVSGVPICPKLVAWSPWIDLLRSYPKTRFYSAV
jgi:hypothetical protein